MDEMSSHPGLQLEALCTTSINMCLGLARLPPTTFHFLPVRAFADAVPSAWTCSSLCSCSTFFLSSPTYLTSESSFNSTSQRTLICPSGWAGTPTTHCENPCTLSTALASFNRLNICMALIQLPFIDVILLMFPTHLINFSFSWEKRRK